MKLKKRCLWLLLFTVLVSSSYSQQISLSTISSKGSIITNKGDTLNGFIFTQTGNWLCTTFYYKPVKDDYGVVMRATDTKGFIINDQLYISHIIHLKERDTAAFVKVLYEGQYSLYTYELPAFVHFIITKPDGTKYDLSCPPKLTVSQYQSGMTAEQYFHTTLDSLFYENPLMKSLASEANTDSRSIIDLFRKYYKISGESYSFPGKRKKIIHLEAGPVAGVTIDKFTLDIPYQFKSYSDPSPFAGLYVCLKNKNGYGFFFKGSIAYKSHHYSYVVEEPDITSYYQTTLQSLAANTEAGISVQYLKRMPIKPFVEGGAILSKYLNPKYNNYHDQLIIEDNTMFSYKNKLAVNNDLFYGGFLRLGLSKKLKESGTLKISAGYDYLISQGAEKIGSAELSITFIPKFK